MFVITGGGSGIGRALAEALAGREQKVLVVGRREQALKETATFSSHIDICVADVSSKQGRDKLVSCLKPSNHIQGLVHNAGIIEPITPLADIEEQAWNTILATNLSAPLFLSQALLPKLKGGRVLHIGSGVAHFPVAAWAPYCVSKAALYMLGRCFQLEYQDPVFASVMPGIIETNMQALIRQSQGMEAEKLAFFTNLQREDRLLKPETVALFLTWLLLDTNNEEYTSQEWDIYDKSHHEAWLLPPHTVPHWE